MSQTADEQIMNNISGLENDANHIFGRKIAEHGLEPLLNSFGGDPLQATIEIQKTLINLQTKGQIPNSYTNGINIIVNGINIIVRGQVVDGIPRIGTVFAP